MQPKIDAAALVAETSDEEGAGTGESESDSD